MSPGTIYRTCVVALAYSAVAVAAQTSPVAQEPALDREFLIQAVNASYAELKYSELVDSRSTNDKVKVFAQKVIKDHKDMTANLKNFASDQKLAIVAGTDAESRKMAERLGKAEGLLFDRLYLHRIVEDHEKAVAMFETQIKQGKDAKLRAFAEQTLPRLRAHLVEARDLKEQIAK